MIVVFKMTNQKLNQFQLFLAFLMFLSYQICFGQWGIVTKVKLTGDPNRKFVLTEIKPPNGGEIKKEVKVGDTIFSGSEVIIPSKTTVNITSSNNNSAPYRGTLSFIYSVDKTAEKVRSIGDNNDGGYIATVNEQINGGVTHGNEDNTVGLASGNTIFLVEVIGKEIKYKLIRGKVTINQRVNMKLSEDLTINSSEKRVIFVNESKKLTKEGDGLDYNSDNPIVKFHSSEAEDEIFFKKQIRKQKKTLLKAGSFSKSGFRLLKKGSDSLALKEFENSIINGEIRRDYFIQSTLLLSEAYLRNGKRETSTKWLDVAFYFTEQEFNDSKELYNHYIDNHQVNAAKAIGSDYVLANEYYAWAYDVKLKLTGCLESVNLSPRKWRQHAEDLKTELSKL